MGSMKYIILFVGIFLVTACNTEPWVRSYETEAFSDPVMNLYCDPLANKYRQHVYSTRERVRGAGIGRGGGCGCN